MNSGAYSPSPTLIRPEFLANTGSARLFNHNYPPKSSSKAASILSYPPSFNQQIYYQPQIQPLNGLALSSSAPNYYQANPPTVFNSPVLYGSEISISSKGLETILIATLILVALDLVVIRPHRQP
ncbi:MAG: hypothetical protein WA113_04675 [Desulfitobacteriaceae bacterium]